HVLYAVDRMDHRARPEEEQRLEEGVRGKVEDRGRGRTDAEGEEHVSELAHGRVRHDPLDVDLHEGDRGREDGRDGADDSDHREPPIRFMTNAFVAAKYGSGRSNQKPISR